MDFQTSSWALLICMALLGMATTVGIAQQPRRDMGIVGQVAPDLDATDWIGLPNGKESFGASDFKGKVTYLYFFQSWCPGCHSSGFPTLQKVVADFCDADDVQFAVVQTTFEGHDVNTVDKLAETAKKYNLRIPFGQSVGESGTPQIMRKYRTGGTPWVVVINKTGQVVFNDFHVDADAAIAGINELRKQDFDLVSTNKKGTSTMTERAILAGGCFWGMGRLVSQAARRRFHSRRLHRRRREERNVSQPRNAHRGDRSGLRPKQDRLPQDVGVLFSGP